MTNIRYDSLFLYLLGIDTCYDEGECGGDDDENNNVGDEVGDEDNVCHLL